MKIKTLARSAALAAVLVAGGAQAEALKWQFSGATFEGGGQITGTFVYDADADTVSQVNFNTSAGGAVAAAAYRQINPTYPHTGGLYVLALTTSGSATGAPGIQIAFATPLTDDGTETQLAAANSVEGACDDDCTTLQEPSRAVLAGSVVLAEAAEAEPIPTLSEWAMILFGAVLAGSAALFVQRRRSLS